MGLRPAFLLFAAVLAFASVPRGAIAPAVAAERAACLSPEERRAVLGEHHAVPLARVMRLVKTKVLGEVVKARLCRRDGGKGLVYVLTVLARNGKVLQARVDAADGHWLGAS
jgi:uncharacterized membrane protein YkoI